MEQNEIFVKLHKSALTSGLIAELGAERWQTLTVLALFMNENGECYPSQDTLADLLNIRRETVNRRIKSLCDFRFNGAPVLVKEQLKTSHTKRFHYNVYYISQMTGYSFGKPRLNIAK